MSFLYPPKIVGRMTSLPSSLFLEVFGWRLNSRVDSPAKDFERPAQKKQNKCSCKEKTRKCARLFTVPSSSPIRNIDPVFFFEKISILEHVLLFPKTHFVYLAQLTILVFTELLFLEEASKNYDVRVTAPTVVSRFALFLRVSRFGPTLCVRFWLYCWTDLQLAHVCFHFLLVRKALAAVPKRWRREGRYPGRCRPCVSVESFQGFISQVNMIDGASIITIAHGPGIFEAQTHS